MQEDNTHTKSPIHCFGSRKVNAPPLGIAVRTLLPLLTELVFKLWQGASIGHLCRSVGWSVERIISVEYWNG